MSEIAEEKPVCTPWKNHKLTSYLIAMTSKLLPAMAFPWQEGPPLARAGCQTGNKREKKRHAPRSEQKGQDVEHHEGQTVARAALARRLPSFSFFWSTLNDPRGGFHSNLQSDADHGKSNSGHQPNEAGRACCLKVCSMI